MVPFYVPRPLHGTIVVASWLYIAMILVIWTGLRYVSRAVCSFNRRKGLHCPFRRCYVPRLIHCFEAMLISNQSHVLSA